MKIINSILCISFVAIASAVADELAESEAERVNLLFFENEIRPLLSERCYKCHSEKKQKGDLRLDHIDFILQGGESGPALVPGNLEESLMIEGINYLLLEMPPDDKQLPADEVALLEKWVAMGAPWPENEKAPASEVVDEYGFSTKDHAHWSLQKLSDPSPPSMDDPSVTGWVQNEIDPFIARKHVEAGLTPAVEAGRRELIRRAYFDLHGLPPPPAKISEFVNDPDPQAYEHLLDELLASPRYGERWGRHWLDLVRYADSDGYNQDAYRPSAWPYRDWVIKSINADMPYDQFVRFQLAGDEIAPDDLDTRIATSFLRNGIYEYNLRDIRGQWDSILNDMTDVVGEVFLGRSFACARCHDHKFDPILQKDYFALRAFFEPVQWQTGLKLGSPEEISQHAFQLKIWEDATVEIREKIHEMVGEKIEELVAIDRERFPGDIQAMVKKPDAERTPLEKQLAMMAGRMPAYIRKRAETNAITYLETDEEKQRYAELQIKLKEFDPLKPEPLMDAFVVTDVAAEAPPTMMVSRSGEQQVEPAFLTILKPEPPHIHALPNSTGRRTALAEWITQADNVLSTRVIVNRLWQYHFGRGIAGTPSDFGNLGDEPSHPELLDWLARRFVVDGWSFKKIHKLIMQSATYRQTAQRLPDELALKIDPSNTLLWRFSPRRLDAEQIRDAMLAVSGELDVSIGGEGENASESLRRSVYTIKKRNTPDEFLNGLDAPLGFLSSAERQTTTTPTQALLMINGDWTLERARKMADNVPDINNAWKRALGRSLTPEEKVRAQSFLERLAFDEPYLMDLPAVDAVGEGEFKPNSPRERLQFSLNGNQGEDFSVEALVEIDLHAKDGYRTIVSRWGGEQNSQEACGWSLAIAAPQYLGKTGNLVFRMVGVDANDAFRYHLTASGLEISTGKQYFVAAYISSSDQTVTFYLQDLNMPDAELKTEIVEHLPLTQVSGGNSPLMIGGITGDNIDLFNGHIEKVRISIGPLPANSQKNWAHWKPTHFLWNSKQLKDPDTIQLGASISEEERDPLRLARADLYHSLLNSNEFFYLH